MLISTYLLVPYSDHSVGNWNPYDMDHHSGPMCACGEYHDEPSPVPVVPTEHIDTTTYAFKPRV